MRTLKKYQKAGQYVWTGQNHTIQKPTGHYNVVATDNAYMTTEQPKSFQEVSVYEPVYDKISKAVFSAEPNNGIVRDASGNVLGEQPIEPLYGFKDPVFNLAFLGAGLVNGAMKGITEIGEKVVTNKPLWTAISANNIKNRIEDEGFVEGVLGHPVQTTFDLLMLGPAAKGIKTVGNGAYKIITPQKIKLSISPKEQSWTPEQWTAAQDAAVARGDMAEAQRLRDLHARINRYDPLHEYHGSNKQFKEFKESESGIYFTPNEYAAEGYARGLNPTKYDVYLNFGDDVVTIDNKGLPWNKIPESIGSDSFRISKDDLHSLVGAYNSGAQPWYTDFLYPFGFRPKTNYYAVNQLAKVANEQGKTGLKLSNAVDNGKKITAIKNKLYDQHVVFKPNQIKSANAVTYDDNGVRIPLGLRDNFKLNDIRYGLTTLGTTGLGLGLGYKFLNNQQKQSGGESDKMQYDNVRIDPNGFWDKRNVENGKVIIPSNRITMKGVNFPVLGVSDTGDMKLMLPNGEYKFNGNNVTEYKMKNGGNTTIGNTSFDMMDKFKRTIMSPQYATQVDNSQEQFQSGGDWVNAWKKSQSDMRSKANYLMGDALATMYDQAYNPIISEREYTDWYKNPNYNPFNDKALEQYRKDKDNLQNKYGLDVVEFDDGSFIYRDKDGNEYGDMDDFYNEKYSELSKRDQQIYDLDKSTDAINAATSNLSKMTGMPNLQIGTFMHNKINGIDMPHAKWGRNWEYVGRTYGEDTPSGFNPNDYTSVYKKGRITAWSTAPIQQSPVPTEEQKPERERRNPYRPLDGIEGYITSPEQLSDVDWGKRGQYRIQVGKVFDDFGFDKLVESQVKKHNRALTQQARDDWKTSTIDMWNNEFADKSYNPLNPEFQFNQESKDDFKTQYSNWLEEKKMYDKGMKQINRGYRQGYDKNPQNVYNPYEYWNPSQIKKYPFTMARGGNWKEMQEISLDPNTEYVSRSGTERTIDYGAIADILRSGVRFATGVGYGIEANKSGLTDEQLQAAKMIANNPDAVEVRDPGDIAFNTNGLGTTGWKDQTEIQHYAQYGGRTFEKGGVYHNVTLEELKKLRDSRIKYKII